MTDYFLVIAIFLTGTYDVAAVDDIWHMKASRSFLYVWMAIGATAALWRHLQGDGSLVASAAIVVLLGLACRTGVLGMTLAWGDIIALAAAILLLAPMSGLVFLALVAALDRVVLRTFYGVLLRRSAYPFMPAVAAGMALSLLLAPYTGAFLGGLP